MLWNAGLPDPLSCFGGLREAAVLHSLTYSPLLIQQTGEKKSVFSVRAYSFMNGEKKEDRIERTKGIKPRIRKRGRKEDHHQQKGNVGQRW